MMHRKWSFWMPARDHFFIKRFLTYFYVGLTDSGKILLAALFIGGSIASPGLHISAYLLPCFIFTLLLTAFGFAYFFRPQISAKRLLPPAINAGGFIIYRVLVTNTGRRPIRRLIVSEGVLPFGLYSARTHEMLNNEIDHLNPGETTVLRLVMEGKWRGIYRLPVMLCGSSYPSGLLRWVANCGEQERCVVYPSFVTQSAFQVPFHRVYQPGGIAVSSHVGESNEFLTTREFRQGDRLRDIHWPSYAHTGKLIVKEYVDEYFVRIGLFLDTEFSRGDKINAFERRISIAAGIADAIAREEYIIDLFAAGEALHHFQLGRALAHLDNLLELLACVQGTRRVDFAKLHLAMNPYLANLSSMIILLKDWDEPRSQFCHNLRKMNLSQRIIVIRDQPLSCPPDQELVIVAGHENENQGLIR